MMSYANKMDELEGIYNKYEGNIHAIINNEMLSNDDFNYIVELKEFYNGK